MHPREETLSSSSCNGLKNHLHIFFSNLDAFQNTPKKTLPNPMETRTLQTFTIFQIGEIFHHKAHPIIHRTLSTDLVRGYSRMLAKGDAIGGAILRSNELLNDAVLNSDLSPTLKFNIVSKAANVVGRADGIGSFNLGMYEKLATNLIQLPMFENSRQVPPELWVFPILLCVSYIIFGGKTNKKKLPIEHSVWDLDDDDLNDFGDVENLKENLVQAKQILENIVAVTQTFDEDLKEPLRTQPTPISNRIPNLLLSGDVGLLSLFMSIAGLHVTF